jgi:hypothetical protein
MSALRLLAGIAWLSGLAGCTLDGSTGPGYVFRPDNAEIVDGPVRISLAVAPADITPPGTVVATLTYENRGPAPVTIVSNYGCLSFASVYRGEEHIPFPVTAYACTTEIAHFPLAGGATLTTTWPLEIGGEHGVALVAGTYRFVAELNTHPEQLERTFVVR